MLSASVLTCLAILSVEFAIGCVANGLIVSVHIIGYLKSRSFSSSTLILSSLGFTRFGFQCVLMINGIFQFVVPDITNLELVYKPFIIIWMFLNFSSLWCATWLCVFYCVKIANISLPMFEYLKRNFSKLLPVLLLGSMFVSLAFSLPFIANIKNIFGTNTSTSSGNDTTLAFIGPINYSSWSLFCILGSFLPFLLFLLAVILLLRSLRCHIRRMKEADIGGYKNVSFRAHFRLIKTMVTFFLFYASFVITVNISASGTVSSEGFANCACALVISAYPSLHSVTLILGNSKLKEAILRILPFALRNSRSEEIQQIKTITT